MMCTRTAADLVSLCTTALSYRGVPAGDGAVVAELLIEANLRGHDSHGVDRLPRICQGLDHGAIRPVSLLRIVRDAGPTVLVDGNQSLGPVAASDAVARAQDKALRHGVGVVSVRHASHIGMLGFYVERLARAGLLGIVLTNAEPAMAPFGAAEPVLGSNPLAFGFPSGDGAVVVDLSTTVVARGKLLVAMNRGESIPEGWAVDGDGEATTDPAAALRGALLGIGGPKGYCLAVAVDLLTGALAGGGVGREVTGTFTMTERSTKSDFFLALDPAVFAGRDEFSAAALRLADQIKASRRPMGGGEVLLPGEREQRMRELRLRTGIPVDPRLLTELERLASGAADRRTVGSDC